MGVAVGDQSMVQIVVMLFLISLTVAHVESQKPMLTCLAPYENDTESPVKKCVADYWYDIRKKVSCIFDCDGHVNKRANTCVNIANPVRQEL
jgi:hypothetical protein